jgi:Holliday junction resolvase
MAKNTKNNGQKNTSKKASNKSDGAKVTAQSENVVKATETAKDLILALDVKSNHGMRKKLNSERVDAFALHSHDKLSKAYLAQCFALARDEKTFTACMETRMLIVNGVANWIKLDNKSGNYVRNGALSVRNCEREQAVYGNVNSLVSLYGDSITVLTEKEVGERFDSVKEQTTRIVGSAKREIVGRVVASGLKGDMILDVLAWREGKALAFVNCESKRTYGAKFHAYSTKQTTTAK